MPALLAASGHFSPTIRLPAVQALGRLLGDSRALMVLVSSLSETAHRGIVATAAEQALVEWGPMAAPPMVVLASQGAWPTRVRALRLLAKVGGPAQLSAVLGLRGERGRWPKWTLRWRGWRWSGCLKMRLAPSVWKRPACWGHLARAKPQSI